MQNIRNSLKNRKGFTLIELIVVIVILGILAAILVPTFSGYAAKADKAADKASTANVKTVLSVLYAEGKITAATVTINNSTVTASSVTGADATYNEAYVQNEIAKVIPNLKVKKYYNVVISINSSGVITESYYIAAGTTEAA